MLIKLPIIKNNTLSILNFCIKINYDRIVLDILNRKDELDIYEVVISNLNFCLTKVQLDFPLELEVLKDNDDKVGFLLSKFFMLLPTIDFFKCELDFFRILLDSINKYYNFDNSSFKKLEFANLNFISENYLSVIRKSINFLEEKNQFVSIYDLKLNFDNKLNYILNLLCFITILEDDKKEDIFNKFSNLKDYYKIFLEYKIKFNGSNLVTINEHLNNINKNRNENLNGFDFEINNNIFNKNESFYIKINNDRILKLDNINDNTNVFDFGVSKIKKDKCKFFKYDPKQFESFNCKNLLCHIFDKDFDCKMFICSQVLNQVKDKSKEYIKLYKYLFYDNSNKLLLSSLNNLNIKLESNEYESYNIDELEFELDILSNGYEDKNFIIYLNEKYSEDTTTKLKILGVLFKNYNFPLTFNKKRLNTNFELIMYFSFLNFDLLVKIVDNEKIYLQNNIISIVPPKLKNLFYNLLKFYYQYQNNSLENITYNFKFYQDYIYIYIIKNIIQKTTSISELFRRNELLFGNLVSIYKKNFILNQMINNLTWNNLTNRLNYIDYFYKCNDLIFYQGKINKNLFDDNVDFKIKNIIIDKFAMFKYLKYEKDFVKWIKFIKNYYSDLYEKPVQINNEDLAALGKLIYKLLNLDNQDLKNVKYIELLSYCQKNKKLILQQSRINLKIKEKLPMLNCQLNLGYFAKHLNFNNHDKIEMDEKNNDLGSESIDDLKSQLEIVTKKYQKYKGKYVKFKTDSATATNSTIQSSLNINNN